MREIFIAKFKKMQGILKNFKENCGINILLEVPKNKTYGYNENNDLKYRTWKVRCYI